jgi:hypothetical protein
MYRKDEVVRRTFNRLLHAEAARLVKKVERANYKPSSLKFEVEDNENKIVKATFCSPKSFDPRSHAHINGLNQWRDDLKRHLSHHPAEYDKFTSKSTSYSEIEKRWLRNRFASHIDRFRASESFNLQGIADEFNATFAGRFVPNKNAPCGVRNAASLRNVLNKEKVDEEKVPYTTRANFQTARRLRRLQKGELAEYKSWVPGPKQEEPVAEADESTMLTEEDQNDEQASAGSTETDDSESEEEKLAFAGSKVRGKRKRPTTPLEHSDDSDGKTGRNTKRARIESSSSELSDVDEDMIA